MKFSCTQKELNQGISAANRLASRRTTVAITQNALLETQDGMLKITTTNLEQTLSLWIKAAVEEEGATTVPARLLSDFVGSMDSDSRVDFEIGESESILNVHSRRCHANLITTGPEHFPKPIMVTGEDGEEADGPLSIGLNPESFRTCISRVAGSAATEESRPVLTGVNLRTKGKYATMAAADGFRLAVDTAELEEETEETESTIPAATIKEMERLMAGEGAKVTLLMNSKLRSVMLRVQQPEGERAELTTQVIQGNFPNYEQLIPQNYVTKTVLDAKKTARAVKTASIFATDSHIMRLNVGSEDPSEAGQMLTVSAMSGDMGDGKDEVEIISMEGEPNRIAFNAKYLAELIGNMSSERLILEVNNASSPGVFRIEGNDDFVAVIMPMFVQW